MPSTGVTAVAVNLTVADETGAGGLTAYADGTSLPVATSVSYATNTPLAATAIVPVGSDGKIDIYNNFGGSVDVIGDIVGYFTSGSGQNTQLYHPMDSTRLVDTRMSGPGLSSGQIGTYPQASPISAVNPTFVINLTATSEAGTGFLSVYPTAPSLTGTTTLNYVAGFDQANLDLASTSNNTFNVYDSGSSTQLVIDTNGYFASY